MTYCDSLRAAGLHKLCITWINSCFRVILLTILHGRIEHYRIFNIQSSNLLLRLLFPSYWGVMCPQDKTLTLPSSRTFHCQSPNTKLKQHLFAVEFNANISSTIKMILTQKLHNTTKNNEMKLHLWYKITNTFWLW